MAITPLTLAKVTDHSFSVLLIQDGAAGTTLTITNAQLQAFFTGAGLNARSPMLRLLQTAVADQAAARARMLGDAAGLADVDLTEYEHAICKIVPRTLIGAGWLIDANVAALLPVIDCTGPAGASTCLVTFEFQHTVNR